MAPPTKRTTHARTQKAETPKQADVFIEIGESGLDQSGGIVQEEWLRELRGLDGVKRLREMIDNCPITGAILYAIKHLARGVTWTVESAEGGNAGDEAAEFVRQCLFEDLNVSWQDYLSEVLTFLPYGWAYHELVFKRRAGPSSDSGVRSRFKDGRIGLRKMPLRAQESLYRWRFDEAGGVEAMEQQIRGGIMTIPISKALLFRTEAVKGNPEGRSILRNAYITYQRRKRIENMEGIGIERDLAGYPVFTISKEGPDIWNTKDANAVAWKSAITKLYKSIRRDEQEGMVKPWWLDFQLASAGSRRQFDTTAIIERMDRRIAMTTLWDFLLIGHQQVGSYSLVSSRSTLAAASLQGFLESIATVMNRFCIPKLMQYNGFPEQVTPTLKAGAVEAVSLDELGAFLTSLTGLGYNLANLPGMLQYLFAVAKVPVAIPDDWENQPPGKEVEEGMSAAMLEAAREAKAAEAEAEEEEPEEEEEA